MTPTLIEAARAALDALDGSADFADMMAYVDTATEIRDAANALRAAIEAAEKAEPVAMLYRQNETGRSQVVMRGEAMLLDNRWHMAGPLYLHPTVPEVAR